MGFVNKLVNECLQKPLADSVLSCGFAGFKNHVNCLVFGYSDAVHDFVGWVAVCYGDLKEASRCFLSAGLPCGQRVLEFEGHRVRVKFDLLVGCFTQFGGFFSA